MTMMPKKNTLFPVALFVLTTGCTPMQKAVKLQHYKVDRQAVFAVQKDYPTTMEGVIRKPGLYLGRGDIQSQKPDVLTRQIGGIGMDAIEPKTIVDVAAQLASYIRIPVNVAGDVYQASEESGTSVTDSTGGTAVIGSSNNPGNHFPETIRYRFSPSETIESILTTVTNQFGLSWVYDEKSKSFEIYRYKTVILHLPVPNTDRTLEMNVDSTVLKATLNSVDKLQESLLSGVKALATDEAKIQLTETGSLLVRDRPASVASIRSYIEKEKRLIQRQTLLKVRLYTYDTNESSDIGVNWEAVFSNGSSRLSLDGSGTSISSANTGSFSILDPTSKLAGTTIDVDALAKENGLSVEYENDLLTLSGRAVTVSQTRRVAYLKKVTGSNSASSDLVQSTLEPGEIDTGLSLYLHPFVHGDDILVTMGFKLTSLVDLPSESSGNNRITTPETANRSTSQVVRLKNGGAMVMAGFRVATAESTETGVATPAFKALGGASKSKLEYRRAVLVITADIVE